MDCRANIQTIAELKLQAADCLLANSLYDDAYYIAGYAVELFLKTKVCKTLGVDGFFNFNPIKGRKDLYKPYKVHDYTELLLLSGLYPVFEEESKDVIFKGNYSIIALWNEGCRYEAGRDPEEVKEFVSSVKEFCKWIQKYL